MVANTTRGITYPTGTDGIAPLHTVLATMATSMDTALGKILYRPADLTALAAITGMVSGDLAVVTEGGAIFEYSGSVWLQSTPAYFASNAARDAAYAKAAGVYRTTLARVRRPEGWIESYIPAPIAQTSGWFALDGATPGALLARSNDVAGGTNTTASAVSFNTVTYSRGMTWAVGQSTRLVTSVSGRFLFGASAAIGSTSIASAWFRINGGFNLPRRTQGQDQGVATVGVTDVLNLAAGDYVELMTISDGAYTIYGGGTSMSANLIGPL